MGEHLAHWQRVTRATDSRTGIVKDIEGVLCHVRWDDDRSLTWEPSVGLVGGEATPPGIC